MNKFAYVTAAGLLGVCLVASAAKPEPKAALYPKELIGIWQGDGPTCELPGNLDSDTRMDIRPDKLLDYEQWNLPLSVVQVSSRPKAWRIKSRLYIDGDFIEVYELFALTGHKDRTLTVVDESRVARYVRCR